jgi:hypothetical protein
MTGFRFGGAGLFACYLCAEGRGVGGHTAFAILPGTFARVNIGWWVISKAGGCYESQAEGFVFLDGKCDAQPDGGGILAT